MRPNKILLARWEERLSDELLARESTGDSKKTWLQPMPAPALRISGEKRMKIRHSALIGGCWALIFVGCTSLAGFGQAKSADAVRTADQDWLNVFADKNLDKSVAFLDEKGAMLSPNAPIADGREAVSKLLTGFFALPDLKISWHVDRADVARSGDLGYTSGAYEMTFSDATGKKLSDKGKYVTVWKKQKDGSWKVLLDIFNTDLPPTGAS